jgi:hypothetical protein
MLTLLIQPRSERSPQMCWYLSVALLFALVPSLGAVVQARDAS